MVRFFARRWFLVLLAGVLVVGIAAAKPLAPLATMGWLRTGVVAVVLFLMALPLDAQTVWKSIRRPLPPLIAVFVSFGLAPPIAWLMAEGLSGSVMSAAMAVGLLIPATTPCTLASASVWTRRAGGNDGVAIVVTVLTNLICFLVTPLWLLLLMGRSPSLSPAEMIAKLALVVVLPMALAQMLRHVRRVGPWATRHKIPLGVAAQCGILTMVLMGAVGTGQRLAGADGTLALELTLLIAACLLLHIVLFAIGIGLGGLARLEPADRIAVGFSGSQKTLMVGLQMAMELGVTILPMVAYHIGQLIVDTLIADEVKKRGQRVGGREQGEGSSGLV